MKLFAYLCEEPKNAFPLFYLNEKKFKIRKLERKTL